MAENKKLLMYKGKPLVRKDNTLYYGYMDEPCIIMMQITSTKDVNGAELSDKILVQLVSTNEGGAQRSLQRDRYRFYLA